MGEDVKAGTVKRYFQARYVRVGDALGAMVHERYIAEGGEVITDLIAEDSVLADSALVTKILREVLSDAAEDRRANVGLSWADFVIDPDYEALQTFGRVYPEPIELTGDAAREADRLAARIEEIEVAFEEAEDDNAQDALQAECDDLSKRLEAMTQAYSPLSAGALIRPMLANLLRSQNLLPFLRHCLQPHLQR